MAVYLGRSLCKLHTQRAFLGENVALYYKRKSGLLGLLLPEKGKVHNHLYVVNKVEKEFETHSVPRR